ncbi:MAG TPA: hypothetical protein VFE53_11825 [Mucilaginibacter sp.]|jgi:hypothetical protein|nr:hypothetical protein [Mucilaginibacter sp.]
MYTLITGATTSMAYKVKNSLIAENIILGDYAELPSTMLSKTMIQLPNPASPSYAHEMLALCLDKEIDHIYALKIEEQNQLATAIQLFSEYGIAITPASGHEL